MRLGPRRAAVAAACAAALLTCACSGPSSAPRDALLGLPVPTSATVTTARVAGLGTIVVDGQGHALYMFPPDAGGRVSCTGPCAGTWPPLVIADGHRARAGRGIIAGNLSTLPDPNSGQQVVTYGGYPLYRYAGDVAAGTAYGQALFLNGGPWYVLSPDGQSITVDPAAAR